MINVIAIDNLRGIPFSAKLGLSLISYYAIAALFFFIPTALVVAELATSFPNKGGVYVWVKEAFGDFYGFITIWLQWIYNVVWYPIILTFVAANFATMINPSLEKNNLYMWLTITILFWACTFINYYGLKVSSIISTIGATIGTLLPMLVITLLGFKWFIDGNPSAMDLSLSSLSIQPSNLKHLSIFCFIIFGLIGIEMSAVHADEVDTPKSAYPKAILQSSIIIFVSLILSTLAVSLVVKESDLSVTTGLIQAFIIIFHRYHIDYLIPYLTICIIIGSISSVVTWIIGPTKGLLVASHDNCLPKWFCKTNSEQIPTNILRLQAAVFTALSFAYIFIPNVDSVYEILSILTTQLALFIYILMFASAIKLRYKNQNNKNSFQVPGGKLGLSIVAVVGTITCISVIIIGFIPPPEVHLNTKTYIFTMLIALFLCLAPAVFLYKKAKQS
jgi:glutamate:GABA antiporter